MCQEGRESFDSDLHNANLRHANLYDTELYNTDLTGAMMVHTIITEVDLRTAKGLTEIVHVGH